MATAYKYAHQKKQKRHKNQSLNIWKLSLAAYAAVPHVPVEQGLLL